jgi:hypothetical protein
MAWPLRDGSDCGSRASAIALAAAACCAGSLERLCGMSGLEKADLSGTTAYGAKRLLSKVPTSAKRELQRSAGTF